MQFLPFCALVIDGYALALSLSPRVSACLSHTRAHTRARMCPPVREGWVRYIYNYYDNFFLNFYE